MLTSAKNMLVARIAKSVMVAALTVIAGAVYGAPGIVSVQPVDGAIDVKTFVNIRVDFDREVDAASINNKSILVNDQPLSDIPEASVTVPDGKSAIILLRMSQNKTYKITLTTAIRDLKGEALAKPFSWRFVTASNMDEPNTPVQVFARYPRMNDRDIPTNVPITVSVTTEIDDKTFSESSVIVRRAGNGHIVPGKLTVQGRRIIFRPNTSLSSHQTYEVEINAGVKGRWGLSSEKPSTWQFTTGDGPSEGPIVTDAWFENYTDANTRWMVFHASVENLVKPTKAAHTVKASSELAEGQTMKGAVVSLNGLMETQPLSTPNDLSAKDMPVISGLPNTVVRAEYTHGGGAGAGNSVGGDSRKDPAMEKIMAAVNAALAGEKAVTLQDSGDIIDDGDKMKGDGVYSARLSLEKNFPEGQAFVAFSIALPDGKKTEPITISAYVMPLSQVSTASTSPEK